MNADDYPALGNTLVGNGIWVKSSLSGTGNCVEVDRIDRDVVRLRDSKDPDGPVLTFTRAEWQCFVGGVRLGEFDVLDG